MSWECPPQIQQDCTVVEGRKIHYYTAGPDFNSSPIPPTIFVPGAGEEAANWWPVMGALAAEGLPVLGYNPPGSGDSEPYLDKLGKRRFFNTREQVTSFCRFLRELQIRERRGVGISNGGAIVIGAGLRNPDLMERAVVFNSYGFGNNIVYGDIIDRYHHHAGFQEWAKMCYGLPWVKPFVEQYLERLLQYNGKLETNSLATESDLLACLYWQGGEVFAGRPLTNYSTRLHEIQFPLLIAHSEHDQMIPIEVARKAWQAIVDTGNREVYFEEIGESGHRVHLENTAKVADLVIKFMSTKSIREERPMQQVA